jgi:hypothetical protein
MCNKDKYSSWLYWYGITTTPLFKKQLHVTEVYENLRSLGYNNGEQGRKNTTMYNNHNIPFIIFLFIIHYLPPILY